MKNTLLLTSLGCMAAAGAYGQATAERPNVILLVADDLGYGDLSCYGAERVSTPRVDSIARGGVRFTDAHAVASTSTPSRYSLLTGEYSFRRPETNVANGDAHLLIDPDQYTLADMFRDQGYTTAAIGKWHLGLGSVSGQQNWNRPLDLTPEDIGFDYSYIMAATADRVPCVFIENGSVKNYDPTAPISVSYTSNFAGEPTGASNPELLTKLKPSPNHGHNQSIVNGISRIGYMKGGGRALWRDEDIADSIATYAVRFMGENADKPFFMYLCTNDVHVPRYPHERFRGKSPMGLRGEAILQFDYTVGLIADALDSLGIADNTLLIITSDNGPVLDDGYQDQAVELAGDHKPGGPWRGGKYSAFEAGTAVPLIVNWPGRVPAGKVSDALVSHIDDIASLARLIGAELPVGSAPDSRDHLDTWLGHSDAHAPFAIEMAANRTLSIRTKNWKYIEPSTGAAIQALTGIETGYADLDQLYDITSDMGETRNASSTQPDTLKAMSELLAKVRMPFASSDTCFWYNLTTPNRESRYVTATVPGRALIGRTTPRSEYSQWKFVLREDGDYDIINRADNCYIAPGKVTTPAEQLTTSVTQPATGWSLTSSGKMSCLFAVTNGDSQMNQGGTARNYNILNWGNGTNTTDAGCLFACIMVDTSVGVADGIAPIELDPSQLQVVDGEFSLPGAHGAVSVYDITGKRLTPRSLPKHGIIIVIADGKSYKIAY